MAAPAELNPCPEIEIVKKITASNSLHPAYEAHIKNVAGTIEADKNKQLFFFFQNATQTKQHDNTHLTQQTLFEHLFDQNDILLT